MDVMIYTNNAFKYIIVVNHGNFALSTVQKLSYGQHGTVTRVAFWIKVFKIYLISRKL